MISLAYNFPMQNSLFKIIFECTIFNCEPIYTIFATHFRTKLVLNIDKKIFA